MPRLDPRIVLLRDTTLEAIERLMDSGQYLAYFHAVKHFHTIIMERKAHCGFDRGPFMRFYAQVVYWKRTAAKRQSLSSSSINLNDDELTMYLSE